MTGTAVPDDARLAVLMDGHLRDPAGKMGFGVLRYSRQEIVAVVDLDDAGGDVEAITGIRRPVPIVATIREAVALGADTLVVGFQGSGGRITSAIRARVAEGLRAGMSIVSGLHDHLCDDADLVRLTGPGAKLVDLRKEPAGLPVATGKASALRCRRVVTVGTDMAQGKMTTALEIVAAAGRRGEVARFLATGQIGVCVRGGGVALDAVRVDHAAGAIERLVIDNADGGTLVIEGQGSILHPGSTAWLPILRGASPTHLILTHRAGQERLLRVPEVCIPPLRAVIELYERVAAAPGVAPPASVVGVALNCAHLDRAAAARAVRRVEDETSLPTVDPVRSGGDVLLDAVLALPASTAPA